MHSIQKIFFGKTTAVMEKKDSSKWSSKSTVFTSAVLLTLLSHSAVMSSFETGRG